MKITDIAILFIIITLPFTLILDFKSDNLELIAYKNIKYNRYLDTAVEDACFAMIKETSENNVYISKEDAVAAFFKTLSTNFGVLNDDISKSILFSYIPVIVIVDYDGFYIYSTEIITLAGGRKEYRQVWKPKKYFSYERGNYIYYFTLDENVLVYNKNDNKFIEGKIHEIKDEISDELADDDNLFNEIRKKVITNAIKEDVNYYINYHNNIAKEFGISYHFQVPEIDDSDWHNTIKDLSFIAFFQGMPLGIGGEKMNSFALGGARIVMKSKYYLDKNSFDYLIYHKEYCPLAIERNIVYNSRKEAALKGAMPCEVCKP